jgi:hypothetical protein
MLPSGLAAQVIGGRVLEAETQQPIKLATLELLDDRGKVLVSGSADSTGAFRLRGWMAGKYRLRASALGYRQVTSDVLELATGDEFELDVQMVVEALPIEPVRVVARSRNSLTEVALRGYYDRRDSGRRIGMGRFLDRIEIEQAGTRLTDVLRKVPGLRVIGKTVFLASNPGCTNTFGSDSIAEVMFYLDGMLLPKGGAVPLGDIDHFVPLDWVEAIEVYRRPAELPAEFLGSGACGVVAIWTRRG